MAYTPPDSSAQGYLLLTLNNVRVVQVSGVPQDRLFLADPELLRQVYAGNEALLANGELV